MADIDYSLLSQAFDTSWGRSSTPKTASYSVKTTLLGPDRIMTSYAAIVQFATEKSMIEMKRRYAEESKAVTAEALKQVKANYKDLSGKSLSTQEISANDRLEIINFNVHSPLRKAYYRLQTVYEIG